MTVVSDTGHLSDDQRACRITCLHVRGSILPAHVDVAAVVAATDVMAVAADAMSRDVTTSSQLPQRPLAVAAVVSVPSVVPHSC